MNENHLWPYNAYDDQTDSGRRLKPRGKRRKRFVIEFCFSSPRDKMFFPSLAGWHTYSRYASQAARDQAFAALVKKEKYSPSRWIMLAYRRLNR